MRERLSFSQALSMFCGSVPSHLWLLAGPSGSLAGYPARLSFSQALISFVVEGCSHTFWRSNRRRGLSHFIDRLCLVACIGEFGSFSLT